METTFASSALAERQPEARETAYEERMASVIRRGRADREAGRVVHGTRELYAAVEARLAARG